MAEAPAALVSHAIYGREAFIERIAAARRQAAEGGGLTLLVSGEAGIGKSRLTSRATADATAEGWQTLGAVIHEQDRSYPNTVLVELLRALIRAAPEAARTSLEPVAGDVGRLIPEARALFPPAPTGPEVDRRQLFAAAAGALVSLADTAPLLITVEDLHWADQASLDFLLVLARLLPSSRTLLVLTYRDDENDPALSRFLLELDRGRLARDLRLERLDRVQVEAMVRDMLGINGALRADLVQALYTRSDGNPFFVEELMRSALADRRGDLGTLRVDELPIPRSVQDAVQTRAASLSPGALRLLQFAAVIGMRVDFDLLGAVSGVSDDEILSQVKELVVRQLVMEEGEDVFVFRHALTGQAVTAALLSRERRALHGRVLAALEAVYHDDETALSQLAYHAYAAADWPRALDYLTRAGRRSLGLYAPAVALDDFNRALEAASHLNTAPFAAMYLDRAMACDALGDFDRARAGYEEVIAAAANDPQLAWQATLSLGLLWASRDYRAAFDHYERAVALARALDDAALARSLMRLGNWYVNVGDFAAARSNIEEALAKFRSLGDGHAEAEALDILGMACIMGAMPLESARHYRDAIPILEAANDRRTLASTLATLAVCSGTYQTDILAPAMTLAEGRAYAERALQVARGTGARQDECYALWQLGFVLGPMGEYGEALACTREALAIAEELGHEQWTAAALIVSGAILLDLFQLDGARVHLERAHALGREMNSAVWIEQSGDFLAAVYAVQHHPDLTRVLLDSPPLEGGDGLTTRWRGAAEVSMALAEGRAADALNEVDALTGLAQPAPGAPILRLSRLRAEALHRLGRDEEAIELLRRLIPEAESHGHRSLLWRAHAALAALLFETGDRDAARLEADAALGLVESLAATLDEAELAESFRQQASTLLPASLRRRSRSTTAGVLTEREAEIAALIAQGLSNRSIAEELVLSSRTVETHVANAMSKLGFSSRAQLAAWSVERQK
jgi:DNA-binding NarL/FixJ family response regulator